MAFTVKVRGTATGPIVADYECAEHGRFEATVDRDESGSAPNVICCRATREDGHPCLLPAEWRISAPWGRVNPISAVQGGWAKPEKKTWTDTRDIGEGQALYDWREKRAQVWEEKRKQEVYDFARANHERVIGGD